MDIIKEGEMLNMSIFRRKRWEIVEEGKTMKATNFLTGYSTVVVVDVYRRLRKDGTYEYKTVDRYNS